MKLLKVTAVAAGIAIIAGAFVSCNMQSSYGTLVLALPGTNNARAAGDPVSDEFARTLAYQVDCVRSGDRKTGGGVCMASGTFTMNGGTISGNTSEDIAWGNYADGGGVYMNGGTFIMNDGEISGNEAISTNAWGGGVYVGSGTFTMYGGEISGNTAGRGGGLYSQSSNTYMISGEISGNTAGTGGGVSTYYGVFYMSGGEISGNTAEYIGGGVYMEGPGASTQLAFEMSGNAEISGNTAYGDTDNGTTAVGGVYIAWGRFNFISGTIYGNEPTLPSGKANTIPNAQHAYSGATWGRGSGINYYGTTYLSFSDVRTIGGGYHHNSIRVENNTLMIWNGTAFEPLTPVISGRPIRTGQDLMSAQSEIQFDTGDNYILTLANDISLISTIEFTRTNTDINVTIEGNGHSITQIGSNNLFYIRRGTVIFMDTHIIGHTGINYSVIQTWGAAAGDAYLILENTTVSGSNKSSDGGGIYVNYYSTVTMRGNSAVYGNIANNGGGIFIAGNTVNCGNFRLEGGTVYGSDYTADPSLQNNALTNGASLYWNSVFYGSITYYNGTSYVNIPYDGMFNLESPYINRSFRVIDGELQWWNGTDWGP